MPTINGLVAHYHEVGLKGRNRNFFESTLARNLKRSLRGTGYARVRQGFGRVFVEFKPAARVDEAVERAARVFGIVYLGVGIKVPPDLDEIESAALQLMRSVPVESFAVRARRSYSALATTSQEMNERVGRLIQDEIGAPVNLSHPHTTLWIEMFGGEGIVYTDRKPGPGGLPVGVSGRMLALLSGGIDSPVAAWRMARRGAEVEMVHFHGQPYTDPSSLRQATELAEILTRFQLRTTLHLIPLADAQREIVTSAPSSLRVVLYRRAMMRIASALAQERSARALVTGDSLGQVASQTLENITTVDSAVPQTHVLRPLIGMDKQEIIELAERIGTFEISTRRYQDCCVLFEPRSPATRATVAEAEAAEADLDIDAMVGKALAGAETRIFELPDL
jgi:thiamine biosynthesis protein ThiI